MIGGIDISRGKIERWNVTFNLIPETATLVLKNSKQQIVAPVSIQKSGGG